MRMSCKIKIIGIKKKTGAMFFKDLTHGDIVEIIHVPGARYGAKDPNTCYYTVCRSNKFSRERLTTVELFKNLNNFEYVDLKKGVDYNGSSVNV
jgi:hypothetical protein